MTKYVLHGGNSKEINPDNDSFFAEMTKGLTGEVHILLNYFSREESEISKCAEQDKKRFLNNSVNKDLSFEIADENSFVKQIEKAKVIYIRGGNTQKLVQKMKNISDCNKLFADKIIGGSSAGVYVLVKYYWENDTNTIGEGLGIFNIKAVCHYSDDNQDKVANLRETKEDLPILTLANHKWLVVFK